MTRLFEFVLPVHSLSRLEFVRQYDHPFLLTRRPGKRDSRWTFKTQTISCAALSLANLAAKHDLLLAPELAQYDVLAVVKAGDNPWSERVSVGRARNNDLVIGDVSVSKLHAYFTVDTAEVLLEDLGSRNGTFVNDQRLAKAIPVRIQDGDKVVFGRTGVVFVGAGALWDLVSGHMAPRRG